MSLPVEITCENCALFLKDIDTFIFDCDALRYGSERVIRLKVARLCQCEGVLWNEHGQAIDGTVETVMFLRQLGKKVLFISNNSTKTRAEYAERCNRLGFAAQEDDVVCTAWLTAAYLRDVKQFLGKVYLVGGPALATELTAKDICFTGNGVEEYGENYQQLLSAELDPEITAVVVGFDPYVNFPKVLKASSYLQKLNCLFIATNMDSYLPTSGPIRFPGTGSIVQFVAYAAERKPLVMGKPETLARDILAKTHNISADRTVMVGDRLDTDMLFGSNCGFKTLLVLTGAATMKDVQLKMKSGSAEQLKCIPQYVMSSAGNLHKLAGN